jgi:L-asparagine transporter-like permease
MKGMERPSLVYTVLFFIVALAGFLLLFSSASTNGLIFWSLVIIANMGFWGLMQQVSEHITYAMGRSGLAQTVHVLCMAVVVIVFLFSLAYLKTQPETSSSPATATPAPQGN